MPTSKEPVYTALVSDRIIAHAQVNPDIRCNLRFEQRPVPPDETGFERKVRALHHRTSDHSLVYEPVRQFLKALQSGSRVLLHFQGYSANEIGTAMVVVDSIYWTHGDDYPRLDFKRPEGFDQIHGCPNFWGAFILAIVGVKSPRGPVFACEDKTGVLFMNLAGPWTE